MKKLGIIFLLFIFEVLMLQAQEEQPQLLWTFQTGG